MNNITEHRKLFDKLTHSDEVDEFNTGWINKKSIECYNKLVVHSQPSKLVRGEQGYAIFDGFVVENRRIPYKLKIFSGLNSNGTFDVRFSPRMMIPSIVIYANIIDIPLDHRYYNSILGDDYLYIFSDDINIILLSVIDIYRRKFTGVDDYRDYECSVNQYMYGKMCICGCFYSVGWEMVKNE